MEYEDTIRPELDNNIIEEENTVLTPKNIERFSVFAVTLKRIHVRLLAEGYIINDGHITKSERLLSYEQDNNPNRTN